MKFRLYMIVVLSTCLFVSYAYANDCLIINGAIMGIKIGDQAEKIFSTFESGYRIVEEKKPYSVRMVNVFHGDQKIIKFSLDPDNKILFVDAYGNCATTEHIGVGSTLGDALKTYGKGRIMPTDEGYLIYFERIKGVFFLLDNQGIPKRLRNIPDDVFNRKQEKEILKLTNIRISSIKLVSK